jgi:membrane associated rhomboid family serine protease
VKKDRLFSSLRMLALPLFLLVVFLLQLKFPEVHKYGALWSDRPRWWQFITCNFLSRDPGHLLVNMSGLMIVYTQFAPQIKGPFLALAFVLTSTVTTWLFYLWFMPSHAWLIGASGGSFALLGFFSWFLRRAYFGLFSFKKLKFRFLPVLVVMIISEYFIATYWMPQLAWQLHAIGFGFGVIAAMVAHALYAGAYALAKRDQFEKSLHTIGMRLSVGIMRMKEMVEISDKSLVGENV